MGSVKINVNDVLNATYKIRSAQSSVNSVKSSLNNIRYQIDPKIMGRNNIGGRYQSVVTQISNVEYKIGRIKNVVENGANSYLSVDRSVSNAGKGIKDNVGKFVSGGILGAGTLSELAKQFNDKVKVDAKQKHDGNFKKVHADKWNKEAAVISGKTGADGEFLGFKTHGEASGDVMGGSIKRKGKINTDIKKGELNMEGSLTAEGHLAKGKISGGVGLLSGSASGTVGSASAKGEFGVSFLKNGKFDPSVKAKAKAEATALKGEVTAKFGNSKYDAHAKASGKLATASAEASGEISKDKISGKIGAEACLAEGKISGGFKVFGVKIDVGLKGKAGAVGVSAKGEVTTGGMSGEIGGALGLGGGVEVKIDWTGLFGG